jgi:hypothetical protein
MNFADKTENQRMLALIIGDSGSGKTAALASLAEAGYKLKIHDYDNGLDVLTDPAVMKVEARSNIDFITLTDPFRTGYGGGIIYEDPTAFVRGMQSLNSWDEVGEDGGINDWDADTVYICDSLTFMGEAAMRYHMKMQGKLGQLPSLYDWNGAIKMQEDFLNLLTSSELRCHVILNCHMKFQEVAGKETKKDAQGKVTQEGETRAYPSVLGRQLPAKIGRYVNNIFFTEAIGSHHSTRRRIKTQTQGFIDLKNGRPSDIEDQYDVRTGLAEIFKIYTGSKNLQPV